MSVNHRHPGVYSLQAQRCRHGISPHTLSLFLEPLEQLPQLLDLGGDAALGGATRGRVLLHAAAHAEHLSHIAAEQGAAGTARLSPGAGRPRRVIRGVAIAEVQT